MVTMIEFANYRTAGGTANFPEYKKLRESASAEQLLASLGGPAAQRSEAMPSARPAPAPAPAPAFAPAQVRTSTSGMTVTELRSAFSDALKIHGANFSTYKPSLQLFTSFPEFGRLTFETSLPSHPWDEEDDEDAGMYFRSDAAAERIEEKLDAQWKKITNDWLRALITVFGNEQSKIKNFRITDKGNLVITEITLNSAINFAGMESLKNERGSLHLNIHTNVPKEKIGGLLGPYVSQAIQLVPPFKPVRQNRSRRLM